MATILDWIAMGRPRSKSWTQNRGYYFTLPQAADKTSWKCSASAERTVSSADREMWYDMRPGCRAQFTATEGLAHSVSAGGFIGSGMVAPADARVPVYVPPPPTPRPYQPPPPGIVSAQDPRGATQAAALAPSGAISMPIKPDIGFAPTAPSEGIIGGLIGAGIGFITGGPGGIIPGAITGYGAGESPSSPGSTGGAGYGAGPSGFAPGCPTGYVFRNGRCEKEGLVGWVQQTIPGGQTGVVPYQPTQMGGYGMMGASPEVRQQTTLRCEAGWVLGTDNLCYPKRMIPARYRKHPPGTRPLLTGGEVKTLRKIGSLQKKVEKVWAKAGKPGNRPAPKKQAPPPIHHHHPKA